MLRRSKKLNCDLSVQSNEINPTISLRHSTPQPLYHGSLTLNELPKAPLRKDWANHATMYSKQNSIYPRPFSHNCNGTRSIGDSLPKVLLRACLTVVSSPSISMIESLTKDHDPDVQELTAKLSLVSILDGSFNRGHTSIGSLKIPETPKTPTRATQVVPSCHNDTSSENTSCELAECNISYMNEKCGAAEFGSAIRYKSLEAELSLLRANKSDLLAKLASLKTRISTQETDLQELKDKKLAILKTKRALQLRSSQALESSEIFQGRLLALRQKYESDMINLKSYADDQMLIIKGVDKGELRRLGHQRRILKDAIRKSYQLLNEMKTRCTDWERSFESELEHFRRIAQTTDSEESDPTASFELEHADSESTNRED